MMIRKVYACSTVEKHLRPKFEPKITYGVEEVERSHHDDALVISIPIANAWVKRVMVDTGSSVDILYLDAFMGDSISPLETTILPITIREESRAKTMMTTFMVVNLPSAYNVILGRPTLNKLKAMVSTYHWAVKFLTSIGIGESRSDPRESRWCYFTVVTLPRSRDPSKPRIPMRKPGH